MVKVKGKKKNKEVVKKDNSTVNKSDTDKLNNDKVTLLQELINHNIFFDNLVSQLGLGNASFQNDESDDDDDSIDDDVYEIEETKKFKKGQNEENRETKRARLKQQNNLDSSTKEEKELPAVDVEEGVNTETTMAVSAQELREKFQKKLESIKIHNPKSSQSADSKKSKRDEAKKKKKDKQQKTLQTEKNKKPAQDKKEKTTPTKADDLANIDYGKIDGLNPKSHYHQDNKSLAHAEGGKKHLIHKLRDAEKKKEQIQKLQSNTDTLEKAKEIQWEDTLKVASGEMRNNNDPMKLKKKIKQKLKKKEQSAKAWKARLERQEGAKIERQKIRTYNLQQRKKGGSIGANLSKKRIAKDEDDDGEK